MKGYVAQKGGRFYAVIYEGLDPVTGRERRSWHPAGTDRAEAEQLPARLAAEQQGRADAVRQGPQRTTRPRQHRVDHPDLPAPHTRNAGRRRPYL
jgi:hypothetical protein